jgi:uncharacterized OB-fold protein
MAAGGIVYDPVAEGFWQGCRRGELMLQRCSRCERFQFYPRSFCVHCEADDPVWTTASGRGRVYAVTTLQRPPVPDPDGGVVLALVDLEEGPRLLTRVLVGDASQAPIGTPVQVAFRVLPTSGGRPVPVFFAGHRGDVNSPSSG